MQVPDRMVTDAVGVDAKPFVVDWATRFPIGTKLDLEPNLSLKQRSIIVLVI